MSIEFLLFITLVSISLKFVPGKLRLDSKAALRDTWHRRNLYFFDLLSCMSTSFYSRFSVFFVASVLCALFLSGCATAEKTVPLPESEQAASNATASIQVLGPNGETMEAMDEFDQDLGNGMVLENVSAEARAEQGNPDEAPTPGLISFTPLNATYEEYTRSRYDMVKGRRGFALFFFSTECEACITLDSQIAANLRSFPEDSYILKSDYAKDIAIRTEYEASKAGTVLVFDGEGTVIYKSSAPLLDDVKAALSKALGS